MDQPVSARPVGLTGIVLAGGRSRRLGQPKPLVRIGGRLMLERVATALHDVCDELIVVLRPGQSDAVPDAASELHLHVVADSFSGAGPLAGIEAGLTAAQTDLAFVIAADHPFLSPELIAAMAERAEGYDATVPRLDGRLQPLHAVYRPTVWHPMIKSALAGQRLSPSALLDNALSAGSPRILVLDQDELARWDPGLHSFRDINTAERLSQAEQIAHRDEALLRTGDDATCPASNDEGST